MMTFTGKILFCIVSLFKLHAQEFQIQPNPLLTGEKAWLIVPDKQKLLQLPDIKNLQWLSKKPTLIQSSRFRSGSKRIRAYPFIVNKAGDYEIVQLALHFTVKNAFQSDGLESQKYLFAEIYYDGLSSPPESLYQSAELKLQVKVFIHPKLKIADNFEDHLLPKITMKNCHLKRSNGNLSPFVQYDEKRETAYGKLYHVIYYSFSIFPDKSPMSAALSFRFPFLKKSAEKFSPFFENKKTEIWESFELNIPPVVILARPDKPRGYQDLGLTGDLNIRLMHPEHAQVKSVFSTELSIEGNADFSQIKIPELSATEIELYKAIELKANNSLILRWDAVAKSHSASIKPLKICWFSAKEKRWISKELTANMSFLSRRHSPEIAAWINLDRSFAERDKRTLSLMLILIAMGLISFQRSMEKKRNDVKLQLKLILQQFYHDASDAVSSLVDLQQKLNQHFDLPPGSDIAAIPDDELRQKLEGIDRQIYQNKTLKKETLLHLMKPLMLICFLFLSANSVAATHIEQLYQEHDYSSVIQKLSARQDLNAAENYILGNAYFNSGDFGKAYLSYRKSAMQNPLNKSNQHNLKRSAERLQQKRNTVPLSGDNLIFIIALLFFIYALSYKYRKPLIFIFIPVLFFTVVTYFYSLRQFEQSLCIVTRHAKTSKLPGEEFGESLYINPGTTLRVLEERLDLQEKKLYYKIS
ncbi:MAG: hypothetical protein HRT89_01520, partial [Lentisphaeria bacterium]|nr:hypothetical protein [Lentisphaeria bacterium]